MDRLECAVDKKESNLFMDNQQEASNIGAFFIR
jgi:hypothetical protein